MNIFLTALFIGYVSLKALLWFEVTYTYGVGMPPKKNKDTTNDAINRLAESSERLERATMILIVVTAFLFIFTFVGAAAGYNYPGGAANFGLAIAVALILMIILFLMLVYLIGKMSNRKRLPPKRARKSR
jgi:uncharacterized membrane protein